jgi:hypothetical protein
LRNHTQHHSFRGYDASRVRSTASMSASHSPASSPSNRMNAPVLAFTRMLPVLSTNMRANSTENGATKGGTMPLEINALNNRTQR